MKSLTKIFDFVNNFLKQNDETFKNKKIDDICKEIQSQNSEIKDINKIKKGQNLKINTTADLTKYKN